MTRTSREVIQVFCAFPAMSVHCPCQHVKCPSFLIGGLSNVLLLFVIRLIGICTCCYPPLIIHAQLLQGNRSFGVVVRSWWGGRAGTGRGENEPLGACLLSRVLFAAAWGDCQQKVLCHSHCVLTVDQLSDLGFLSGIIRQNWNDTEKISMAPAQG